MTLFPPIALCLVKLWLKSASVCSATDFFVAILTIEFWRS